MVFTQHAHQVGVHRSRVGLVARDHLELAATQAGGDLEPLESVDPSLGVTQRSARPDSGSPNIRTVSWWYVVRPGDRLLQRGGFNGAVPHRLQLTRRSWQHDDGRLAGHHHTRRGADRIDDLRTDGHHRLLAVGGAHRVEVDVGEPAAEPLEYLGDLLFELVVEHEVTPAEPSHDLDRHVVGRRSEAAAGDDQVHTLVGLKPQRRFDVAASGRRRS